MEFARTYLRPIRNRRNNLGYSLAFPDRSLACPSDIPRVYSADYSYCYLRMAWKNVASFFYQTKNLREIVGFN
jgi:hypothetical protein